MGKEKKKYESGAATLYISRSRALRKLQLSLADFRRLCILKGIYPHEPHNKRKAAKGKSGVQTFFYQKDINYISHEPLINTFRAFKIFMRKVKKARDKGNHEQVERLKANKPKYVIDHIVKERYPSFIDAIRDLDDCLTLCFVFATFPKSKAYIDTIKHCRRLTVEFMHYVIASRSLRKVFVSIKGIYYQAEIMGQIITWIVPHSRGFQSSQDVDFRVMQTFIQFYTTFLGFVNYQLYHNLNLHYPPTLEIEGDEKVKEDDKCSDWETTEEMIAALSKTIKGENKEPVDENIDEYPIIPGDEDEAMKKAKEELSLERAQRGLFEGLKFFINRECPREDLTFMLRSFGGEVSWDYTLCVGSTYTEDDESITHHIVDRPSVPKQYVSRYYVQPQWIFDSINARRLLPESEYFMGAMLPPHFSPFVAVKEGEYDPKERHEVFKSRQQDEVRDEDEEVLSSGDDMEDDETETMLAATKGKRKAPTKDKPTDNKNTDKQGNKTTDKSDSKNTDKACSKTKDKNSDAKPSEKETVEEHTTVEEDNEEKDEEMSDNDSDEESDRSSDSDKSPDEEPAEPTPPKKMRKMRVDKGRVQRTNPTEKRDAETEERRLAELMIPKKKKRLYQNIMKSRKRQAQAVRSLEEKRSIYEKKERKKQLKVKKTQVS